MKYTERTKPQLEEINKLGLPTSYDRFEVLKSKRDGEYLIKLGKSHPYFGTGNSYILVDSFLGYGIVLGSRRDAAWFKRDELAEIYPKLGKGYRTVKRNKS